MLLAVTSGIFGLRHNVNQFEAMREMSEEADIATDINSNLQTSLISFKDFLNGSDEDFYTKFREIETNMNDSIKRLKAVSTSPERLNYILNIEKGLAAYSKGFLNYELLDGERSKIYDNVAYYGGEMIIALENLSKLSIRNDNKILEIGLSNTTNTLLEARLHSMKFFTFHSESEYQLYLDSFDEMSNVSRSLSTELSSSPLYNTDNLWFKENSKLYMSGLGVLHDLINKLDDEAANMTGIEDVIGHDIDSIITSVKNEEMALESNIQGNANVLTTVASLISFAAVILTIIVSAIILNLVMVPILSLKDTFESISSGDIDFSCKLNDQYDDEIGQMAKAFNKFMIKLKTLVEEVEYQNWLQTAQNEIRNEVVDQYEITKISRLALTYLCEYLGLKIGAIYVKNDDDFHMSATYACSNDEGVRKTVVPGEGVVGQCVIDKKAFILNELPEDYMALQSGLGHGQPTNIAVIPCLFENNVEAVIEVGSLKKLTDKELDLLVSIAENIGQTLHSAILRNEMKELLEKTLHQSEELQMQQEELRQSNEELEEQTRALKESEQRLQAQQEELRVSNEELEQRTKQLELQKESVDNKNNELIKKQTEIMEKADALELANTYKSEFLANMSHELRTPLNSILVLSKLLTDRDNNYPLTKKETEFADTINSSGTDLLKLINDILDLSKVEAGHLEIHADHIVFSELLVENERMFAPMAEIKGLELVTSVDEALPRAFKSDVVRIQQIIKNLVSNAIKFTHEGTIYIKARKPSLFESDNLNYNANEYVAIEVSDTGIGIESDKKNLIFEAFRQADGTTSRKFGGTGLGLTISRELSGLLGGEIILESTYGEGSKFVLILPLTNVSEDVVEVQESEQISMEEMETEIELSQETASVMNELNDESETMPAGVKENSLLIIEDDMTFARILADLAEEKGFRCHIANDGRTGRALATTIRPSAIIMDIGLPDIDGVKLSKELGRMEATKHIPIHIISGMEKEAENNMPTSVIGFLKKPVEIKTIYQTLAKIEALTKTDQPSLLVVGRCGDENFDNFSRLGKMSVIKVATYEEATDKLSQEKMDCIVLDFALTNAEILKDIFENYGNTPIIIYSEIELNEAELDSIKKYSDNIILKGVKSEERLKDEVTLFLHGMAEGIKAMPNSSIEGSNMYFDKLKDQVQADDIFADKRILIVDDDERNVFALSSLLQKHGIETIVARDGGESIDLVKESPDIDLILMDIMMPKVDGYEAIETIRGTKNGKDIPIIVLSAKAMKENKERCLAVGASDYMTKPIDVEKLMSLLRVWIK